MERFGARAPSWCRYLRVALVAGGVALLPLSHGGAAEADRLSLLSPGLGCGQDQGAAGAGLLARVRQPRQRAAAPVAPPAEEEGPALLLHAFYACAGRTPGPVPMGAGWLAVGPVRRG